MLASRSCGAALRSTPAFRVSSLPPAAIRRRTLVAMAAKRVLVPVGNGSEVSFAARWPRRRGWRRRGARLHDGRCRRHNPPRAFARSRATP